MSELVIKHTNVFTRNYDALQDTKYKYIVNQGGTRSSKTWSITQVYILYCLTTPNKKVAVVRKFNASLRDTVIADFLNIMRDLNIFNDKHWKKGLSEYHFPNGTVLAFHGVDDAQKIRGRKRDLLLCNEANELDLEDFVQLDIRTKEKIFIDFNPSDTESWIYDVMKRDNCKFIQSTYKDNTFLDPNEVKTIDDLILVDKEYYNIYALGLPAKHLGTVYSHQQIIDRWPELDDREIVLGLDFGHNHPTALIETNWQDEKCYVRELLYKSKMTSTDLVNEITDIFGKNGYSRSTTIVCDYARPEIIDDLNRNGFNAVNAIKHVKEGIDAVKSTQLYVPASSTNLVKEFGRYSWKQNKNGTPTDEVVKAFDDAMDAMRYAILYKRKHEVTAGSWEFEVF
jgi:phage terminase large subunit